MEHLSKKSKKKITEGAGLLLSLLRGESVNFEDGCKEPDGADTQSHVASVLKQVDGKVESVITPIEDLSRFEIPYEVPCSSFQHCRYQFDETVNPVLVTCERRSFQQRFNFLKGCKWSPSGSQLLANSEDRTLRVFQCPDELDNDESSILNLESKHNAGDLVYDYCWYPRGDCNNSDFIIYSSCDHPIQMRNATTGELVATFVPKNHLDERTSAYSICFSLDGSRLYSGYKEKIKIFDTHRPGPQTTLKRTKGDKSLGNGQTGIISCIAMCPSMAGVFACGSYARTVAIYADDLELPQFVLQGHQGGITHMAYHPDGTRLYSGARKDNDILCWDMRNLGNVLSIFERKSPTNQRIYFEINGNGDYLLTGNDDGTIKTWSLEDPSRSFTFKVHDDCVNGVSFHPHSSLIATASGQRSFWSDQMQCSDDDENTSSSQFDNSIKIWSVKKTDVDDIAHIVE